MEFYGLGGKELTKNDIYDKLSKDLTYFIIYLFWTKMNHLPKVIKILKSDYGLADQNELR